MRAYSWAKELVYPSSCTICDRRGSWLCAQCESDWIELRPALFCDRCGHPITSSTCYTCRHMHPAIVKARGVAAYSGWPASSLQRLKYDRERDRSVFIAERMVETLRSLGPVDAFIPVPLHETRRQDRGFNQSELIARHLSRLTGIPVENALIRVKQTASQTKLNRAQREENLRNAMARVPGWVADPARHYVLIDDVYTTGTTTGACAEQLSAAGVENLSVLTFMFDLQGHQLQAYIRMLAATGSR